MSSICFPLWLQRSQCSLASLFRKKKTQIRSLCFVLAKLNGELLAQVSQEGHFAQEQKKMETVLLFMGQVGCQMGWRCLHSPELVTSWVWTEAAPGACKMWKSGETRVSVWGVQYLIELFTFPSLPFSPVALAGNQNQMQFENYSEGWRDVQWSSMLTALLEDLSWLPTTLYRLLTTPCNFTSKNWMPFSRLRTHVCIWYFCLPLPPLGLLWSQCIH